MPAFGPISRHELVRYRHQLGFKGPHVGERHECMVRGSLKVFIANPHAGEIGSALLARILRQADIDRDEWTRLWNRRQDGGGLREHGLTSSMPAL